jgi:hypothetical protein
MIGKPGRRRIDPVKRRPTHHHERTAREGRPKTTPGRRAGDRWLDGLAPLAGWPVVATANRGMGDPVSI